MVALVDVDHHGRLVSAGRYIRGSEAGAHSIGGVNAVKSLTEGPKSFEDALKSPFWNRLPVCSGSMRCSSSSRGSSRDPFVAQWR